MYKWTGSYDGPVPLKTLAERLESFVIAWAPSGYGTTTEHGSLGDVFPELRPYVQGEWPYVMGIVVKPSGGAIRLHKDTPSSTGVRRHHVVLQTNPACWSFHDGEFQQLEEGGIYTLDETREHAAVNWGETERIHLVIDAVAA